MSVSSERTGKRSLEPKWGKPKPPSIVSKIDDALLWLDSLPTFQTATPSSASSSSSSLMSATASGGAKKKATSGKRKKKGTSSDRSDAWAAKLEAKKKKLLCTGSVQGSELWKQVGGPLDASVYSSDSVDTTDRYQTVFDLKGVFNATTVQLLAEIKERRLHSARLCRAPADYYSRAIEYRCECLKAPHVNYLCKALLMKNTKADPKKVKDWSQPTNSLYYLVIFQYTTKLNSEKIMKFVRKINGFKLGKRQFKFRLAPESDNEQVTGFEHNAVAAIGLKHRNIPLILSHRIVQLGHFWMGGGEVDLKFAMNTAEFRNKFRPFVADITYDGFIDPNENLEH